VELLERSGSGSGLGSEKHRGPDLGITSSRLVGAWDPGVDSAVNHPQVDRPVLGASHLQRQNLTDKGQESARVLVRLLEKILFATRFIESPDDHGFDVGRELGSPERRTAYVERARRRLAAGPARHSDAAIVLAAGEESASC
jgi:hypothetical protein